MKRWKQRMGTLIAAVLCLGGLMSQALAASPATEYTVIAGGLSHSVAMKEDGTVWTWGYNEAGQLGMETDQDSSNEPQQIPNTLAVGVTAGYNFTAIIRIDGSVQGWGAGQEGSWEIAGLDGIVAIDGGQTNMILLRKDGTVWSWTMTDVHQAYQVPGLSNIVEISAGGGHYMALTVDGQVYAWGRNDVGQLGLGHNYVAGSPTLIPSLKEIVTVEAGYAHSLVADYDGNVYGFGSNSCGQLGTGTTTDSNVPVQVKSLKNVVQLAAGTDTSMALDASGDVFTWGYGEYGQMGVGNTDLKTTKPEELKSITGGVLSISAGGSHNMFVSNSGRLYTWGRNRYGQLGTEAASNTTKPFSMLSLGKANTYEMDYYSVGSLIMASDWAQTELQAFYDLALVPPSNWQNPTETITRGGICKLLVNVYESVKREVDESTNAKFTDIAEHPLKSEILKAYRLGIISGRSAEIFDPDAKLTRQEAAKALCDFVAKMNGESISTKVVTLDYYNDALSIGTWAIPYVAYAYDEGIMSGAGGNFNPMNPFSKEQALLTVARLVERYDWG